MFYDKFKALCDSVGISCNKAALAMGLSNATPTKWKKTGATPDGSTVAKLTAYFDVPTDFLLERPPFDFWEMINQNRKGFLHYVDIDPDTLQIIWGIDLKNPDATPMKDFISFLSMAVENARPTSDGDWEITLRPNFEKEKASTQEGRRSADLSPAFFRLKQGLEPYDLSESDADFLVEVYKAHIRKNQ